MISTANNFPGGGSIGQSYEVSAAVTDQSPSRHIARLIREGATSSNYHSFSLSLFMEAYNFQLLTMLPCPLWWMTTCLELCFFIFHARLTHPERFFSPSASQELKTLASHLRMVALQWGLQRISQKLNKDRDVTTAKALRERLKRQTRLVWLSVVKFTSFAKSILVQLSTEQCSNMRELLICIQTSYAISKALGKIHNNMKQLQI